MQNRKYNHNDGDSKPQTQLAIEKFADMMIARMEEMKESHWKKGWIDGYGSYGLPQNIVSGTLNGGNSFFLQLDTAMHGYKMPLYMTFLQAQNMGLRINKGAESMPVIFWDLVYKDQNGKRIDKDTLDAMTREERKALDATPILRVYKEFNVDQTNLAEVNPQKYEQLQQRFMAPEMRDDKGMYVNAAIDRMLQRQEWVCPVQYDQLAPGASFSPSLDRIVIPMKSQFNISSTPEEVYKDGMEYYSTFLHEATHSTGTPERLNRVKGKQFGDTQYGHEEYVAEMTAAVVGNSLGFDKRILDNNTAYIQGWIQNLRENPKVILGILSDVNKASNMLLDKIDQQKIAIGETPILGMKDAKLEAVGPKFENAAIVKQKNGEFAARATIKGTELEMKPVAREIGIRYFSLPEGREKQRLLSSTLNSSYASEINSISKQRERAIKIG
ncbi:MAG: DUF1738 domain-containing protein [Prevotella sp.]|nr:DUF1738 domain-containing protein [Prevotella sp.]